VEGAFLTASEEVQNALLDAPVPLVTAEFAEQTVIERSRRLSPQEWEDLDELVAVASASEVLVNTVRAALGVSEDAEMIPGA
jgi:hypothetical protein